MTESTEGEGDDIWDRLRRRKVVQWGIVYAAGAWGLLQGLAYVTDTFHWPEQFQQLATVALLIGLPVVLVLAWYHGDRGEQRVTRVELAILALLFLLGGGLFWRYQGPSEVALTEKSGLAVPAPAGPTPGTGPSIAVLPFENRSDQSKDAYFVDGIHDDILTQLSKISALKVISRTSVERFRKTDLSANQIAAQLGVSSILEGGVQRAGNRVRINVQLIDAGTDAHLWAETYDRELTAENIFAIQTELATAIAGALRAALTPAEKARAAIVPTRNLEAWESYQLGQQQLAKRTGAALAEAGTYFRRAIELDPRFALAHAGLAESLALRTVYTDVARDPTLEQAQQAADAAMKLDPGLSEAWSAAGLIAENREQYSVAEQMLHRAIELNPNNSMAHMWLAQVFAINSRFDDAVRSVRKAADLDPLSAIIQVNLAGTLEVTGLSSDIEAHYRRAIELDPLMSVAYSNLSLFLAYSLNRFADAVPLAQKAAALDPANPHTSLYLAALFRELGDERRFLSTIDQADSRWPDNPQTQLWSALAAVTRRDDAGAVRHAERALALHPRDQNALRILRDAYLKTDHVDDAVARYRAAYPELLILGKPRVDVTNYDAAVDLALVLQKQGETAQANVLLDGADHAIAKLPRLSAAGFWITDVQIYTLRGDKARALSALRDAERAGWRASWLYYRDRDPNLVSIRKEPEFKAVFAAIERDMARQRAELDARPKDARLNLGSGD